MSIHKKLLEIQKSMPRIDKDGQNEFFSKGAKVSKYTTLANVLSVLLPLLNTHGILFTSEQKFIESVGWVIIVELIDVESDTRKTTMLPLLNTADMQKMGSCITYAQRYGLLPLTGIAPELDDDGNGTLPTKDDTEIERMKLCMQLDKLLLDALLPVDKRSDQVRRWSHEGYASQSIEAIKQALEWVNKNKAKEIK